MMQDTSHHARRILTLVQGGVREQEGDVVAQSWSRCINEYSLNPAKPRAPEFIDRGDLEARRTRLADLIACARHEMTILYQQLGDIESAVVLTDTDGVIVHMVSSPKFSADAGPLGLRLGGIWSEEMAGTNGMGTCLAAASPVWVHREDHFFHELAQLTCSAVPVYDPSGEITAVLDVSSRSSVMQQHLLVMLGMTARMIENRLIDRRFSNAHPLHFHSRPEFVFTLHEGKLAVDANGQVLAANRSALFQLGLTSMKDIRSRRVEDLFATSLDDMLERSTLSSFHPVVTYHANANLRFFAVAQRPAQQSGGASVLSLALPSASVNALHDDTPATAIRARIAAVPARQQHNTFKDARLMAHLHTAHRVIARQTPILLSGETGAGKEVFARAVHGASPYASGAFVAINCACLPGSLIESELFGYRAGAFTGAQRGGRRGKILQAHRGTLFLDEIADMPLELQARLLRVLDERQVTPLGTEDTLPVDFQLISASHQHLPTMVREHRFREDLYYRLAGIELLMPPLRERSDKRDLIVDILVTEGGAGTVLSLEAEDALMAYAWPGNVRQLRHVLRTALALADGQPISRAHLTALPLCPLAVSQSYPNVVANHAVGTAIRSDTDTACTAFIADKAYTTHRAGPAELAPGEALPHDEPAPVKLKPLEAHERSMLLQLLAEHRWNVSNVAKALGISRNSLYRKLHKLDIEVSLPG